MVSQFCSQCGFASPTGPASQIDAAENSRGRQKYASLIQEWQKRAHFSEEAQWVGEMIHEDAQRCLELEQKIKALDGKIKQVAKDSKIAKFYYPFLALDRFVHQS